MTETFYERIGVDPKSQEWKDLLKAGKDDEVGMEFNKTVSISTLEYWAKECELDSIAYHNAREYLLITSALYTLNKSRSRKENREFEGVLEFYHNVFESYK